MRLALIYAVLASAAFWVGVFSGFYASHPLGAAISNSNPDAWIHPLIGLVLPIAVVSWIRSRRAGRAAESSDQQKLWRISQAVKLHSQNDLAGLQQFYDYVKGVVGEQ